MSDFDDSFSLVRKSVYQIRASPADPRYAELITTKVDLLERSFFDSIGSGIREHHLPLFLCMREMVFMDWLSDVAGKDSDQMDALLTAYERVIARSFRTCMGLLEPTVFSKVGDHLPRLLEDYGAITHFVSQDEHLSERISAMLRQHKKNIFIVFYKIMHLAKYLSLPSIILRSLRDFLGRERYPREFFFLPVFDFRPAFTGGKVFKSQDDFYGFLALSACILGDTNVESIVPEHASLRIRRAFLDEFRGEVRVIDQKQALNLSGLTDAEFNNWQSEMLDKIEQYAGELQSAEIESIRSAPISPIRLEFLRRAVVAEVEAWPVADKIDGAGDVYNLRAELVLPRNSLVELEESIPTSMLEHAGGLLANLLLGHLVNHRQVQGTHGVELMSTYENTVVFAHADFYIACKRSVSRNLQFMSIERFYSDKLVDNTRQVYIKILDWPRIIRVWIADGQRLPISIKFETLKVEKAGEEDGTVVCQASIDVCVQKNLLAYNLQLPL